VKGVPTPAQLKITTRRATVRKEAAAKERAAAVAGKMITEGNKKGPPPKRELPPKQGSPPKGSPKGSPKGFRHTTGLIIGKVPTKKPRLSSDQIVSQVAPPAGPPPAAAVFPPAAAGPPPAAAGVQTDFGLDIGSYLPQISESEKGHDWWGGYRNKVGGKEINLMILIDLVRRNRQANTPADAVKARYDAAYAAPGADRDAIDRALSAEVSAELSTLYGGGRINISSIEDTTVAWFEENVEYLSRPSPNSQITWEQIRTFADDSLLETIIGIRNNFLSISIVPGDLTLDNIGNEAAQELFKAKIRRIIKIFLSGVEGAQFLLTFDAAGAFVTDVFFEDQDTRGLITAATVADSAPSTGRKLGRDPNVYYFPPNTTSRRTQALAPEYTISHENRNFSPLTPFDFDYVITREGEEISRSSFSKKFTQGPSLDTLMENHINAYNGKDFRHSGTNGCLDTAANFSGDSVPLVIADVRLSKSIMQAEKIAGDGDQVDQAEQADKHFSDCIVVLVTPDRQAALQRRLRKGRAILHHGKNINVYRNDMGVDPGILAALKASKAERFVRDNTELFNAMRATVALDGSRVPGIIETNITNFLAGFPKIVYDQVLGISPALILFQARVEDMRNYLIMIGTMLSQIPPNQGEAITDVNIKTIFDAFLSHNYPVSIETLSAIMSLAPKTEFNRDVDYPFLNYSYNAFITYYKAFIASKIAMERGGDVRSPIDLFQSVTKKDSYLTKLEAIMDSFLYKDNDAYKALVIQLQLPGSADVLADGSTIGATQLFVNEYLSTPVKAAKAEAIRQSTQLKTALAQYFVRNTPAAAAPAAAVVNQGGGQRGGARLNKDDFDIIFSIIERASLFINDRFIKIVPDLITVTDTDGEKTVRVNEKDNKQALLLTLIQSIDSDEVVEEIMDLALDWDIVNTFNAPNDAMQTFTMLFNQYTPTGQLIFGTPLNPYYATGVLIEGHPLSTEDPAIIDFLMTKADLFALMTLAILHDLVEGNIRNNASIFTQFIGAAPVGVANYFDFKHSWDNRRIKDIIISIMFGLQRANIPSSIYQLFAGGARTTRRKRNRKHGKRVTLRR